MIHNSIYEIATYLNVCFLIANGILLFMQRAHLKKMKVFIESLKTKNTILDEKLRELNGLAEEWGGGNLREAALKFFWDSHG